MLINGSIRIEALSDSDMDNTGLHNDAFKITVLNLEERIINNIVEKSEILKLKFQQKDGILFYFL